MRRTVAVLAVVLVSCVSSGPFISADAQHALDASWIRGAYQMCRSNTALYGIPNALNQTEQAQHAFCKMRVYTVWNETHPREPQPLPPVKESKT